MALLDRWRSYRKQRQQQAGDRTLEVRAALAEFRTQLREFRTQRLAKTQQLRTQLYQFRSNLAHNEEIRQASEQQYRSNLQQSVRSLSQQTQDFLRASAADRAIMAENLSDSLRQFIGQLQSRTQQVLSSNSQQRREKHDRLRQELSAFVATLQSSVETLQSNVRADLQELQLMRHSTERTRSQNRSQQVQEMLSHSRAERLAQIDALSARLSQFRAELRQYRSDLTTLVWGDRPEATVPCAPLTTERERELQPVAEELQPDGGDEESTASVNVEVNAEDIYSYIQFHPGIRLAEIEQALGISRVQAVDALRFLIQTGSIAQQDRRYFAQ